MSARKWSAARDASLGCVVEVLRTNEADIPGLGSALAAGENAPAPGVERAIKAIVDALDLVSYALHDDMLSDDILRYEFCIALGGAPYGLRLPEPLSGGVE
ncbi:hypothetical protein ACVIGB_000551 [Bradyrhizobium sp. USDA 4341]